MRKLIYIKVLSINFFIFVKYTLKLDLNMAHKTLFDMNLLKISVNEELGNWQRVEELLLLLDKPMSEPIYLVKIINYFFNMKNYKQVDICTQELLTMDFKVSTVIIRQYAISLFNLSRYDDALVYYSMYCEKKIVLDSMDYFYMGAINYELDHLNLSQDYFKHYKNKSSKSLWETYKSINILSRSIEFLKNDLTMSIDDKNLQLARLYFLNHDFYNAIKSINKCITHSCSDDKLLFLGNIYESNHQFLEAIKCYEQVSSQESSYRIAYCYNKLGKYQESSNVFVDLYQNIEGSLNDALSLLNSSSEFQEKLFVDVALLYYLQQDYEQASYHFLCAKGINKIDIEPSRNKQETLFDNIYENSGISENNYLYCSYNGSSFSGNPYYLFKELLKAPSNTHFIAVKDITKVNTSIASLENVHVLEYGSYGYMRALSICQVIIVDSTLPVYFRPKKNQKILNTWHGTPMKRLGYEIEQLGFYSSRNVARCLNLSTHLINPNYFTKEKLFKSYSLNNSLNNCVTGYPRNDILIKNRDNSTKNLKLKLGISEHKKVVLYAPTYRGSNNKHDDSGQSCRKNAIDKLATGDFHFLFKGHYFTENSNQDINDIDTNELLTIVDVLITDYSSIALDFLTLNRPIIYFNFDNDLYTKERGLYFPIEDITDMPVQNVDELFLMLQEQLSNPTIGNKQKMAKDKFCSLEDGNSTRRVLEFLNSDEKQIRDELLIITDSLFINSEQIKRYINKSNFEFKTTTILLPDTEVMFNDSYEYINWFMEKGCTILFDTSNSLTEISYQSVNTLTSKKYQQVLGNNLYREIVSISNQT